MSKAFTDFVSRIKSKHDLFEHQRVLYCHEMRKKYELDLQDDYLQDDYLEMRPISIDKPSFGKDSKYLDFEKINFKEEYLNYLVSKNPLDRRSKNLNLEVKKYLLGYNFPFYKDDQYRRKLTECSSNGYEKMEIVYDRILNLLTNIDAKIMNVKIDFSDFKFRKSKLPTIYFQCSIFEERFNIYYDELLYLENSDGNLEFVPENMYKIEYSYPFLYSNFKTKDYNEILFKYLFHKIFPDTDKFLILDYLPKIENGGSKDYISAKFCNIKTNKEEIISIKLVDYWLGQNFVYFSGVSNKINFGHNSLGCKIKKFPIHNHKNTNHLILDYVDTHFKSLVSNLEMVSKCSKNNLILIFGCGFPENQWQYINSSKGIEYPYEKYKIKISANRENKLNTLVINALNHDGMIAFDYYHAKKFNFTINKNPMLKYDSIKILGIDNIKIIQIISSFFSIFA